MLPWLAVSIALGLAQGFKVDRDDHVSSSKAPAQSYSAPSPSYSAPSYVAPKMHYNYEEKNIYVPQTYAAPSYSAPAYAAPKMHYNYEENNVYAPQTYATPMQTYSSY